MTLEELLNKLIERGWKPRGKNYGVVDFLGTLVFVDLNDGRLQRENALDLRKLTSIESGLWQFVCENEMIENGKTVHDYVIKHITYSDENHCGGYGMGDAEYYMMISALIDEPDLEEFLLDNIKIDENRNTNNDNYSHN